MSNKEWKILQQTPHAAGALFDFQFSVHSTNWHRPVTSISIPTESNRLTYNKCIRTTEFAYLSFEKQSGIGLSTMEKTPNTSIYAGITTKSQFSKSQVLCSNVHQVYMHI
jgi:hypothetical protein